MKSPKKYYWVHPNFEGCEIYYQTKKEIRFSEVRGPYKTLSEAKEYAIQYHKIDIDTARQAIREIKSKRVIDFKDIREALQEVGKL